MGERPSLAVGPACGLGPLEGKSLVEAIGMRVALAPEGRFWSLRQSGRPRSRTYRELWERSSRMAAALAGLSLPRASPIALMIQDGMDFIPAFWACLRAGHVAVPLTNLVLEHRLNGRSRSLAQALACAAPELVIADRDLITTIPDGAGCALTAPDDLDGRGPLVEDAVPAELACLLPTSGSTGTIKLVALSTGSILHRCFTALHGAVADRGVCINTFPIDSTTGFRCVVLNYREYAQLPMDTLVQDPTSLFDATELLRASSFSVTNTVAELVMSAASRTGVGWDLSGLREAVVASETVLPSTVRRLDDMLRRFGAPPGVIRAGYGTTETGILVARADPLASGLVRGLGVPLGTPAPNVAIRVVDGRGTIVPEGTVGEVEVHAPLKAFSAYWGDPEATRGGYTDDGWWRTGDTGLLSEGQLALKGRTKEIFVSNGRKHALGAIDEAMRQNLGPGETAYACPLPGRDGGPEALGVALLASPERRAAAEGVVRDAVAGTFGLSIRMIRLVPASAIPLTPTGKVKRLDLAAFLTGPEPVVDPPPAVAGPVAADDLEGWLRRSIARATSTVAAEIDRKASFTALGLDSLGMLALRGEFTKRFGRDAPPMPAWQEASIAETIAAFSGQSTPIGASGPLPSAVEAGSATPRRDDLLPLSYGQEWIWRNIRSPHDRRIDYQQLISFSIQGRLQIEVLKETLNELVRRHEHLRTTFAEIDGKAGQRIHAPSAAEVIFTDLSTRRRPRKKLNEVRRAAATRILDLETGPLCVAYVTRLGSEDHRFDLLLHHILFDARSLVILFGEIDRIYGSFIDGRRSPLDPVPLQIAEFARDERRRWDPSGASFADEVRWWRDHWRRCAPSPTRFQFERAKPVGSVRVSDCVLRRQIPGPLHDRLRKVSLDRGMSLFVTYCAAVAVTLVRQSSGSDIVLGTYLSNRSALARAATIGYLLNHVQFHLVVEGASTWAEVMRRTQEAVGAVTAHRSIPHHLLTDALRETGTPGPRLQALFQYLPTDHRWTVPGLTIEKEPEVARTSVDDHVSFTVAEWEGDAFVTLTLDGHRHHTAALQPLMQMFFDHLESLAGDATLPTAKARPPDLRSRMRHAVRTWALRGHAREDRSVIDPGAETDVLQREIGLLRSVAGERGRLIERLHGDAELQRREIGMLHSVAKERADLIEALHAEADRQREEIKALQGAAEGWRAHR